MSTQQATSQDLATLTLEAVNAEGEEDFELAISLIRRVLAISSSARNWKIHDRIFRKMHSQPQQQPVPPSPVSREDANRQRASDSRGSHDQVPLSKGDLGGSNFTEHLGNGIKLEMVYIPPGEFMMGTDDEQIERLCKKYDTDWFRHEKPIHKVTFKQGFYLGKYPITQAQYQVIMSENPAYFQGENNPVESVSWHDAQEFCRKLSEKTGKKYKLPSESQWEYACRAGSKTQWCFGDNENDLKDYAWYADNSGDSWLDSLKLWQTDADNYLDKLMANNCQTHPVGDKKPNQWGLYDMHGNVWEYCEDDWHGNYENAPNDGSPCIDKSSNLIVMRGGSWNYTPRICRSAYRVSVNARDFNSNVIGFRVVCVFGKTP